MLNAGLDVVGGSICEPGRPRVITEAAVCWLMTCDAGRARVVDARGGDVLVASSSAACSVLALLLVMRSSGIARGPPASAALLIARLCEATLCELVVRDGITGPPGAIGPPTLGDCGSLLDPDRFKPDSGMGIFDGLVEGAGGTEAAAGVPVKAASDCALALSASASSSFSFSLSLEIADIVDIVRA